LRKVILHKLTGDAIGRLFVILIYFLWSKRTKHISYGSWSREGQIQRSLVSWQHAPYPLMMDHPCCCSSLYFTTARCIWRRLTGRAPQHVSFDDECIDNELSHSGTSIWICGTPRWRVRKNWRCWTFGRNILFTHCQECAVYTKKNNCLIASSNAFWRSSILFVWRTQSLFGVTQEISLLAFEPARGCILSSPWAMTCKNVHQESRGERSSPILLFSAPPAIMILSSFYPLKALLPHHPSSKTERNKNDAERERERRNEKYTNR